MIRDAGEAPYVSQKALKHVLVGLEKLCKLYSDQEAIIAESRMDREELVTYINMERAKYGLSARDSIMDVMEVVDRDAEFFRILVDDVVQLRRYVEACEADKRGRLGREAEPYPQRALLSDALAAAAAAQLTPEERAGLSGPAIGAALRERRLAAVVQVRAQAKTQA